jgi:hypothetical protein
MSAPEVTPSSAEITPPTAEQKLEQQVAARMAVEQRLKGAASWFYWIAGLSLINSVVVVAGGQIRFIIGMGVTSVVDEVARQAGGVGLAAGMVVNLFVAAACAAFGVLGNRRKVWAIWLGMVLYALDGLLLVLFQDWLSVAFHGYALYRIYQALGTIKALESLEPRPAPAVISSSSPMG